MSYADYFLSSPASVVELELFEITHPALSAPYRIVRNQREGVSVQLPFEAEAFFAYRPVTIRREGSRDDLSQGLSIDLGDPGLVLPDEMDRIIAADATREKPLLRYWTFRSDDLSVPLEGPLDFEVTSISTKGANTTLKVGAPERNQSGTGQLYTFNRFPMLRGFI